MYNKAVVFFFKIRLLASHKGTPTPQSSHHHPKKNTQKNQQQKTVVSNPSCGLWAESNDKAEQTEIPGSLSASPRPPGNLTTSLPPRKQPLNLSLNEYNKYRSGANRYTSQTLLFNTLYHLYTE